MYRIEQTHQFKKDLKRYTNDKNKLIALNDVLRHLESNGCVPNTFYPHSLKGQYSGVMECHIQNDFLLLWIDMDSNTIRLIRLGSHSELFK